MENESKDTLMNTIRIKVNAHEKKLINDYWLTKTKTVESQLLNKRRKSIVVTIHELNDIIGNLSMECNHCGNTDLMLELNELCERLEFEITYL